MSGIRGTDDALDTSGVELLVRVLCRAKAQVGPGVERWPPEHQRGCNVLEPLRHLASWTNDTYDMYMLHVHVDSRAHVHVHAHAPVVCVSSDGSCYVLELANSLL